MKTNSSFVIGRAAALSIAVETIVFTFSLIWEMVFPTEFATNLGYIASLLIGKAWQLHGDGRRLLSWLIGIRAISYSPWEVKIWRSVAALFLKISE